MSSSIRLEQFWAHLPKVVSEPDCKKIAASKGKSIKKLFQRQKRGQFEAESVLGDGQSRTEGRALEDIVRSGTVHNLGVRNRSRTRL
jgi:hypothetical protein